VTGRETTANPSDHFKMAESRTRHRAMPLVVRRVKVMDLPVLESLEAETIKRFPTRTAWLDTFRSLLERALSESPDGLLVADYDHRPIGVAVVRMVDNHPLTGQKRGRLEVLSIAPGWRGQGIGERLLKEAEAYLKSRGCQVLTTTLPSDAALEAETFKSNGFRVAAWELEREL
jgi:ribosomal protein S18 acetylase RimI-like enzyme